MEPTPAEQFALEAARTAFKLLGFGFELSQEWRCLSSETDGQGARSGHIGILAGPALLYVWYSLLGPGDGKTWNEGRIDLSIQPGTTWQFFCQRVGDRMEAVPMATIRRDRIMVRSVIEMLRELGNNTNAIKNRLGQLGCTPDATGMQQLVSDLFGPQICLEILFGQWQLTSGAGRCISLASAHRLPGATFGFLCANSAV